MKIAKALLPNESKNGYSLLLEKMISSKNFSKCVLPNNLKNNEKGLAQFQSHPVVVRIKEDVERLGNGNVRKKVELLSLLADYPKAWVEKTILNAGRVVIKHSEKAGILSKAGFSPTIDEEFKASTNRRVGPKEAFLVKWLKSDANIVYSPESNRDPNTGKLKKEKVKYRKLCRNRGFKRHKKDALKAGCKPHSRSHFHLRSNLEKAKEMKADMSMCPGCRRHGYETYRKLEKIVSLLWSKNTDSKNYQEQMDAMRSFEECFTRGGDFYCSLELKSTCVHHCLTYALSDLEEDAFCGSCEDHEHTVGDVMVSKLDSFFDKLNNRADEIIRLTDFSTTVTVDGEPKKATLKQIVKGMGHFRLEEGEDDSNQDVVKTSWRNCDLKSKKSIIDLANIKSSISESELAHGKFLKHLYPDRNQQRGENYMVNKHR